jgi:Flp pilus assembly protein TadG
VRRLDTPYGERGSAPVEFVLVGTLLTLLFLGLVQLGIDYHIRNTLAACAADGARYGANADVASAQAGAKRTNELIGQALSDAYADARPASNPTSAGGAPVVTVTVATQLPLIAFWLPGAGPTIHVRGRALLEPQ